MLPPSQRGSNYITHSARSNQVRYLIQTLHAGFHTLMSKPVIASVQRFTSSRTSTVGGSKLVWLWGKAIRYLLCSCWFMHANIIQRDCICTQRNWRLSKQAQVWVIVALLLLQQYLQDSEPTPAAAYCFFLYFWQLCLARHPPRGRWVLHSFQVLKYTDAEWRWPAAACHSSKSNGLLPAAKRHPLEANQTPSRYSCSRYHFQSSWMSTCWYCWEVWSAPVLMCWWVCSRSHWCQKELNMSTLVSPHYILEQLS